MKVCSQCMRMARKQARFEQLVSSSRSISTTALRPRQSQAQTQVQRPQQPPLIPTTAPTVTTNVTADQQPPQTAQQPASANPSIAEMQRQISKGLQPTPLSMRLAKSLRSAAKSTTETYVTYGLTESLFKSCAAQASYTIPEDQRMGVYTGKGPPKNSRQEDIGLPDPTGVLGQGAKSWWFTELGLEPTFSVWSQVTFLHMYVLTVKMRTVPDQRAYLEHQRYLVEHFSAAAEDKMALLHGMSARGIRNKYLKDLFQQWRGVIYAYDEGIVKGDAVLASAVWRNLWKADEDVDWEKVAMVVAYMRRCIAATADVGITDIAAALKQSSQFWDESTKGLLQDVREHSQGVAEPVEAPPA